MSPPSGSTGRSPRSCSWSRSACARTARKCCWPPRTWAARPARGGPRGSRRQLTAAYGGLFANAPDDAFHPTAFADADGQLFSGDKCYILHFAKVQIPPGTCLLVLDHVEQTMHSAKKAGELIGIISGVKHP